jgi:hypothetical protein
MSEPSLPDGKRSFTVSHSDVGVTGGRYISKEPLNAAKKAARVIFGKTTKKSIRLTIKETTRGSAGKEFVYTATKAKLDKPVTRFEGDKDREYIITHRVEVKACLLGK